MTTNENPSVFDEISTFDPEFTPIYTDFLKSVLEDVGFDVTRADDMQSQGNILRDVLEGIVHKDLIIADLTNANPNVFYELGIAHATRKPVILVTQSIEEVPFDLQSYRLIEYDVHFAKIGEAKEKLANYANGFLGDRIKFGNPFTDFFPESGERDRPREIAQGSREKDPSTVSTSNEQQDERGFIDHLVDTNQGYGQIAVIIQSVSTDLEDLTESMNTASNDINRIASNPSSSSPVAAQRVSRRLANRISIFNQGLEKANAEYARIAEGIEDSLEFLVAFYLQEPGETNKNAEEQIASLRDFRIIAIDGRDAFQGLADTMDALPRMERRLNQQVTRGSEQVRIMAGNIDRTISSINRALNQIE